MPEERHQDIAAAHAAESTPLSHQATKNGKVDLESTATVDSSDVDPCLSNHHQGSVKPKNHHHYEKYISDLQKRMGLPRKWVLRVIGLCLIVLVLFLVVLGLSIGWPTVPHMFRYPICREPECLRVAAQVQENLDNSVSPCTDLWSAVCSKYSKNASHHQPLDRPLWNSKEMLVQKESEQIKNLISTLEPPLHSGTVEWKLKQFYEACMDVDAIAIDGDRPLTNIISELGGWYILRQWNLAEFDGMELLTNLQVRYGVSPFFKIHVEPDPHVPNTHSIRISPAGLGLPDRDYYFREGDESVRMAYKDYIRDIVISLSSTKTEAARFGTDMFNFERRIAEITPDLTNLQNPITTYNAISLEELKLTANMIPFYDILQAMYPGVSISENTEVLVTSLEHLSQVAHVISTTDRQIMNGYLIWCLLREYIPYLSETYTSALNSFNNELFGISKPQARWEICTRLVKRYMGLAVDYHLEKLNPILEPPRQILNEMFRNILQIVKDKVVAKFDDSTSLLTQHLEAKLNTLSLHIGLPNSTKAAGFLKDYYDSLIILKRNLFEGVKNAIVFRRKIETKMLLNVLPDGVFLREALREVPEVRYIPSKNAVVIPRSVVIELLVDGDVYLRPMLYGRLGAEIAGAILSSVLPYGSLWTSDRKILSPFHMTVNDSVRSVRATVDCLSRSISNLKLDIPASRTSESALTVMTELSATKIAYEALLTVLSTDSHRHYAGLEQYEESALYFISFAQTKCSYSTQRYDIYDNTLRFKLPSKSVLNIVWAQLPDFRDALDCAPSKLGTCTDVF